MFKPTLRLEKRVAQRLKGFRSPSIRILRKAIANVHPQARLKPFAVPHVEPPRSLTSSEAWSLPACPCPLGPRRPWEEEEKKKKHQVLRSKDDIIGTKLRDALCRIPVCPTTIVNGSNIGSRTTKPPPRYKPSATVYWTHSVYKYNKATISSLPPLTSAVSKTLRAYFNMSPRIPQPSISKAAGHDRTRNRLRAFVSDRKADKSYIRPDLLGKISFRKKGFWAPFRRLLRCQPRIIFKHCQTEVGITLFVYDRRLEVLRQKLSRLRSALMRVSQADPPPQLESYADASSRPAV